MVMRVYVCPKQMLERAKYFILDVWTYHGCPEKR